MQIAEKELLPFCSSPRYNVTMKLCFGTKEEFDHESLLSPPLEPLTLKGITFRNRLFVAPHMMSHMDFNGRPDDP